MDICIRLDAKETVKFQEKNGLLLKTLKTLIKELHSRTGLKVVLLGTKKNGEMFEIKLD